MQGQTMQSAQAQPEEIQETPQDLDLNGVASTQTKQQLIDELNELSVSDSESEDNTEETKVNSETVGNHAGIKISGNAPPYGHWTTATPSYSRPVGV